MRDWWRSLNGAKKVVASMGAALVALGLGYNVYHTYAELPAAVEVNAAAISTLDQRQAATHGSLVVLNEKLDRVLCLLVLENGEDPLVCEMEN